MLYRRTGRWSVVRKLRRRTNNARKRQRKTVVKRQQRDFSQETLGLEEEQWRAYAEEESGMKEEDSPEAQEAENTECDMPGMTAVQAATGACVLVIPSEQKLTFTGKCRLTCLYGSVQVFGFTINDGQPSYNLYSAHTLNALSIEAQPYEKPGKSSKEIRQEVRAILRQYLPLAGRRTLMHRFAELSSIVLLENLEDAATGFILSHVEYAKIFTPKLNEKSTCLLPEEAALTCAGVARLNKDCAYSMSESCAEATKELVQACVEDDGCPIILVCGPKNVGKSSFTRHLMNRLLNHIPYVEYLECDVGQTEFTPPGSVSLLNVTEPLFGPPFTHQREPRRMVYYGEASCENDLERYIAAVKHVFCFYKRDAPLIINTLGWVKGFGLMLLIDIIRLLSPSHIVQMFVKDCEDMPQLNPQYIHEAGGLHTKGRAQKQIKSVEVNVDDESMEEDDHLNFEMPEPQKLLRVSSDFIGAGDTNNMRCHNNILRDLAVLGYLSKLQPSDMEHPLPLNGLIPYQVPFNAVAVRIIHANVAPAQILYSINASWVGLCSMLEDVQYQNGGPVLLAQTPICDCFGFGIVRGVDMKKKVYHVLTPVPPQRLRMVNCLILGSISVPHSIFKNQPGIEGEVPYVTPDYSFEILGAGKIKISKQRKRREHNWLSVP